MARIFGILATITAAASLGSGIYFYNHPTEAKKWAEFSGNKQNTMHPDNLGGVVPGYVALGIITGLIGFAALGVRPYRPDLGDKVSSCSGGARSWWTGEPKNLMSNLRDTPDQKAVR